MISVCRSTARHCWQVVRAGIDARRRDLSTTAATIGVIDAKYRPKRQSGDTHRRAARPPCGSRCVRIHATGDTHRRCDHSVAWDWRRNSNIDQRLTRRHPASMRLPVLISSRKQQNNGIASAFGSCPAWWCSSAVVKLTGRALSSSAVAAGQVHGWPSKIFG
jgi:hypothetical protein